MVTHRVVILQTIELIVGSRIEAISYPRIKSIISLASDEMTRSKVQYEKLMRRPFLAEGRSGISFLNLFSLPSCVPQEVIPDWQQAASNILVAVGNKHINEIMEEILSKFQPGLMPHFFVVQTLANLSDSNGERKNARTNAPSHCTNIHARKSELFFFTKHLFFREMMRKTRTC